MSTALLPTTVRESCLTCFRPVADCLCDQLPAIDNKTQVLILQHRRERKHAFNSIGLVGRALRNRQIVVGYTPDFAETSLPISSGAGLLYPGEDAPTLAELPPEQRPSQLVILDGTWHHTKTMYRDIPALRALPKYRLPAVTPGRYRIRLEPSLEAMSSLEATVRALSVLEPATAGLDQLLYVFDRMVEKQLAGFQARAVPRKDSTRTRRLPELPAALLDEPSKLVVAYGEADPGLPRMKGRIRKPVYWIAQRLSGERFSAALDSEMEFSDDFLEYLDLPRETWEASVGVAEFEKRWKAFLRPDDTIVVYTKHTLDLLSSIQVHCDSSLAIRHVLANRYRESFTQIETLLATKEIVVPPSVFPGRAGRRLANAVAVVEWLRNS